MGGGEYSCILAPDKRDIQKDDMGEYQETCHEENLCGLALLLSPFTKTQQGGENLFVTAQKVWVGGACTTRLI